MSDDADPAPRACAAHAFGHAVLQERRDATDFSTALVEDRTRTSPDAAEVLLIEDDANDVLLTERALRNTLGPVRVTTARSADEGRERVARGDVRPDLVLVGVESRLGDVSAFLRWLGDGSGLPAMPVVLLLSADVAPEEILGRSAGACRRLVRPLGFDALVQALHRVLPPVGPD